MKIALLSNIEFGSTHSGEITVIRPGADIHIWNEKRDQELTEAIVEFMEEMYPDAAESCKEWYKKSAGNVPHFLFRIAFQFISCNATGLDDKEDFDNKGNFNIEHVHCPIRKFCKYNGVICHPKLNTVLTDRETEVMKLFTTGNNIQQIADLLVISPKTVIKHKQNSLFKFRFSSLNDFLVWAREHNF